MTRLSSVCRAPSFSVATPFVFAVLLAVGAGVPAPARAQADTASAAVEEPPAGLAQAEAARSRVCVDALARLDELNRTLEPLAVRAERIRALAAAVALEDHPAAEPFDGADPLESAVAGWFDADAALGARWAETQDSALLVQRREAREALQVRLRTELEAVATRGQESVQAAGDLEAEAAQCEGAIMVRGVVRATCDAGGRGPLCEAVAAAEPGRYRFVDRAEDMWDLEELRPWTEPGRLQPTAAGGLGGARTATRARRGNAFVTLGIAPLLRLRSELDTARIAEFEANLDTLGFVFEHPAFVMAPALDIQLGIARPLAGETHYLLHFDDLSDPGRQVVWQVAAGQGPVQALVPAAPGALVRLQAGHPMHLTAVRMDVSDAAPGAAATGEAVYSLPLTNVGQTRAVTALLQYMGSGALGDDLRALVQPGAPGP